MPKKPSSDKHLPASKGSARTRPGPGGTDWARVRADHNTGRYTDEELSALHGLHQGSIKRRRLRDTKTDPTLWAKDRTAEVQRATQALLMQDQTVTAGGAASAVMAAALATRDVILLHRSDVRRARDVAMGLLDELAATTNNAEQLARMFEVCSRDLDPEQLAGLREQFKGLLKLHARASSVHKLTDALSKAQALERRAFGISDQDDPGKDDQRQLSDLERAARLTRILDRARQAKQAAEPAPGVDGHPPGQATPATATTPPRVH
ncbi:hypothetical protein UFOVP703_39 [uncultured Caudovirales phage]|uniref:Terminase small subunit n=1 Tax=uncultured Caudovirales phage TaxID=2100421 RepID=A0A6J5NGJ6_9CAUD|nr:hypothetical protein UFOVP703_39 [uncultured Caudovirales phage]